MKKICIASDVSHARMLTLEDDNLKPMDIAYKLGRGESGEVVQIWDDENTDREPDHRIYWSTEYRKYRTTRCY